MGKRRRPEDNFKSVKGVRPSVTDRTPLGYDKRASTLSIVSAEEKEADTGGLLSPTLFVPNEEQLEKINKFTLRKVGAEEVACFTTHSCNDIPDRDDDKFSTKTVKEFAALEPPYSPIGKSFMVSHDTTKLAVGRIFDAGTGTFKYPPTGENHTKLTNDVYIPRTVAANKDFIENMEMGINWAVSVGVMIGGATCDVGKSHDWGWAPWWCSEGHEKGLFYDPDSDEEDSWGWPMPVSEGTKGAMKTIRTFEKAKDMYELSMVFLGAQYMAGLSEKDPIGGIVKTASAKHIPVIGLRRDEAKEIKFPRIPDQVRQASKEHKIKEEDGRFTWVDADRTVWSFTPGEDTEPMFLGRRPENGMNQAELNAAVQDIKAKRSEAQDEIVKDTAGAAALASQLDGLLNEIDDLLDQGDLDSANPIVDQAQNLMSQILDALYENDDADPDENQNPGGSQEDYNSPDNADISKSHSHYHEHDNGTGHSHSHNHSGASYDHGADDTDVAHTHSHDSKSPEGEHMSKKAALAALQAAELPEGVLRAVESLPDDSKDVAKVLVRSVSKEFETLKTKAAAGDQYVKDLRADTLDWYRKAKTDPRSSQAVDVSHIERLLDRVGDDPETMKALIEDYKSEAQTRFGKAVRRSTVDADPNNPGGENAESNRGDLESRVDSSRVKRIHG